MIIPKKGQGSKMALYANHGTGPLLVMVDLLDTLLQRLTHRVHALLWQHCQVFGTIGGFTLEALVIKIRNLSVTRASHDGDIQHLSYAGVVQILLVKDEDDFGGSDTFSDEESLDTFSDDEPEEDFQGYKESLDLKTLMQQFEAAKAEVQKGCTLDNITSKWLDSLLQLSECGLLISSLDSPADSTMFSTASLRSELMAFVKSNRIKAAHLFGSLLSRNFLAETVHATTLEEDVCPKVGEGNNFFMPWGPSKILTMEQPLFAPKAFNCNFSNLEDRDVILDNIWEDRERSLQSLQEDARRAPELLTIAVKFWRRQVLALKEKRQRRKKKKTGSLKKPRHL